MSTFFGLLVITLSVALITGQKQDLPVSETCLTCICEAASGCNVNTRCDGSTCGLFRITWAYWADAGKPTQPGVSPDAQEAYESCVNEPFCAARAVQAYMLKFPKDCNGDGRIECEDYAVIHKLGPYGCPGQLPADFAAKFHTCLQKHG